MGFEVNDLKDVLQPWVHVDEYRSKLGRDDKNCVVSFAIDDPVAAADLVDLIRAGVSRPKTVSLPPEAEQYRPEAAAVAARIKDLSADEQRTILIETGYVMPHWPKPYGRQAGPIEQLVIEQEFSKAGVKRPAYGITGWVILTLIQHSTEDQVSRWVLPAQIGRAHV